MLRNAPSGIDPALSDRLPIDDPSQQPFAFIDFDRASSLLTWRSASQGWSWSWAGGTVSAR